MIKYELIKQYYKKVKQIRFPLDTKNPYLIVYFSENSTFLDDFEKLSPSGIRIPFFRYLLVPKTRIPVTRLTPELRTMYREKTKFLVYGNAQQIPLNKNIIIDLSLFLEN